MSRPQPEAPRPVFKAMLVCDRAIRELGKNKTSLIGLFDRVEGPEFPMQYMGGVSVFARVTDAEGHYQMRLELVRLDDEQTIGRGEVAAEIASRMGSYDLTYNVVQLVFERPGTYEFRLFANGLFVGSAPLYVVQSLEGAGDADR